MYLYLFLYWLYSSFYMLLIMLFSNVFRIIFYYFYCIKTILSYLGCNVCLDSFFVNVIFCYSWRILMLFTTFCLLLFIVTLCLAWIAWIDIFVLSSVLQVFFIRSRISFTFLTLSFSFDVLIGKPCIIVNKIFFISTLFYGWMCVCIY